MHSHLDKLRQKALRVRTLRAFKHCGQEPLRASKYCEQRLCAHLKRYGHGPAYVSPLAKGSLNRHRRRDRALRALKQRGPKLPAGAQASRARTPAYVKVLRAKALCASQALRARPCVRFSHSKGSLNRHRRRDRALRARAKNPCVRASVAGDALPATKNTPRITRSGLSRSPLRRKGLGKAKKGTSGGGLDSHAPPSHSPR